jgi:hypothetical protein
VQIVGALKIAEHPAGQSEMVQRAQRFGMIVAPGAP